MVRYKSQGKYAKYSEEQKKDAIRMLRKEKIPFQEVSTRLKIPISTLDRWDKNPKLTLGTGKTQALTNEEEQLLVSALKYLADCGFTQTRDNLKDMVMSYCNSLTRKVPFKNKRP